MPNAEHRISQQKLWKAAVQEEAVVVVMAASGDDEGTSGLLLGHWGLGDPLRASCWQILKKVLNSSSDLARTAGSNYRWSSPGQGKSKAWLELVRKELQG